jgi:hypothetical protein
MYLDAVETLYGDGEKEARDREYAAAMRRLHERFPDDLDAASLYALALVGTCERKREPAVYMRAAAVAEEGLREEPAPSRRGALPHPLLRRSGPRAAGDAAGARLREDRARSGARAPHAVAHLLRVGDVGRGRASNEHSWAASVDRAKRKSLSASTTASTL